MILLATVSDANQLRYAKLVNLISENILKTQIKIISIKTMETLKKYWQELLLSVALLPETNL